MCACYMWRPPSWHTSCMRGVLEGGWGEGASGRCTSRQTHSCIAIPRLRAQHLMAVCQKLSTGKHPVMRCSFPPCAHCTALLCSHCSHRAYNSRQQCRPLAHDPLLNKHSALAVHSSVQFTTPYCTDKRSGEDAGLTLVSNENEDRGFGTEVQDTVLSTTFNKLTQVCVM